MDNNANFGKYGRHFQECTMQALLTDPKWAEQMMEVFDTSYFDVKYLSFLADRYFAHWSKYKTFPSLSGLVTIIKEDLTKGSTDQLLRDQIIEYLKRIKTSDDLSDLPYTKEKALEFCRKQALKQALEKAVDHMQEEKYEQIVEVIKKAVNVGTVPNIGHDFFQDTDARFVEDFRECVPTGFKELDQQIIFNGGLGKGELGVVVAPTGVGKSHMLTWLGAAAMRAGINVVHYTLELSEKTIGLRYDSCLCDIDSNLIIQNKEKVLQMYSEMNLGKLIIKQYPMNFATVYTLRAHLEKLYLQNFKPGLILIDYADVMRSTRQYDSVRHELKLIYEELRSFAVEEGYPIWTASQSNKEGSESDVVDLSNMSEAYGKAFVADIVLSVSRRTHEKATGQGRIYIAKNRAGRDGLVYPVKIDTARSKFEITGGVTTPNYDAPNTDQQRMKDTIKRRIEEIHKNTGLELKELKNDAQVSDEDKSE